MWSQVMGSRQALVDGHAPFHRTTQLVALQPILATTKRCKDASKGSEGEAHSMAIESG